MNKMITCKNCGGSFSDSLDRCPYCGTMNKKGAYAKFRRKISSIIDSLLGLKVDAERSVSRIILTSILRAFIICAFCVGLALVISIFRNTNYYNDKPYDEERLKNIIWENENISKLDEAYEKGDLETIKILYYENSSSVSKWQHYPAYYLKTVYSRIMENYEAGLSEYLLDDCLYYLFYPEYFTQTAGMSEEELQEYGQTKEELLSVLGKDGYTEDYLRTMYDALKDEYGYVNFEDLRKYLEGGLNG